ncbi:MAG TPA: hypothetical protein VFM38_11280, partial [Candidatus Limnocylindrales bacterium]|nr:hypothetical protein [Candidatus Limnocylindrales bacterium]
MYDERSRQTYPPASPKVLLAVLQVRLDRLPIALSLAGAWRAAGLVGGRLFGGRGIVASAVTWLWLLSLLFHARPTTHNACRD